jgi:glycosyltransferase involved in cell wall biosynthesis
VTTALFLAHRMGLGFGVSVAVEQLARRLPGLGLRVVVGCLESDGTLRDLDLRVVDASPAAVRALAHATGADVIVAHTTPFFEALPALADEFSCWALEYGDPSPAFFAHDRAEREVIVERKRRVVYPRLDGVIAISDFIRADIGWPSATVIPIGCDHMPDLGPKGLDVAWARADRPLRVGTLTRLGAGEARYKGGDIFRALERAVVAAGIAVEFVLMGRGTEADALPYRAAGIGVQLSAAEDAKIAFLRDLDVFVSCSLWEGFNLPLAEAQALGTVGMAFDIGAHPEVTPFVLSDGREFVELLRAYSADRSLLAQHSRIAYHHVRRRFTWDAAALALARTLSTASRSRAIAPAAPPLVARVADYPRLVLHSLRTDGMRITLQRVVRRVAPFPR